MEVAVDPPPCKLKSNNFEHFHQKWSTKYAKQWRQRRWRRSYQTTWKGGGASEKNLFYASMQGGRVQLGPFSRIPFPCADSLPQKTVGKLFVCLEGRKLNGLNIRKL